MSISDSDLKAYAERVVLLEKECALLVARFQSAITAYEDEGATVEVLYYIAKEALASLDKRLQ